MISGVGWGIIMNYSVGVNHEFVNSVGKEPVNSVGKESV